MSALGQKRTWRDQIAMSALPPIADIPRRNLNVRFGPETEVPIFIRRLPEPLSSQALGA
jgi:hypothetical protein